MGYQGYLIKVGTYTVPFQYIASKSFKCGIQGQDLDSKRSASGILKRKALENEVIEAEWSVPGPISECETRPLFERIQEQYENKWEKKVAVTAWMPEIGTYVEMDCYMPSISFTIDYADEKEVTYESYGLKFIGYGGKVR